MNGFDAFVLLAALALVCLGILRGLVRISLGLGGLVLGLLVALQYEGSVAPSFERAVGDPVVAHLLAFAVLVMAVLAGSILLAWALRRLLKKAHLGWLDRLLGAAVGLLCATLLAAAVAVPLASVLPKDSRVLAESRLAPVTLKVSRMVVRLAPQDLREKFLRGIDRIQEAAT
jgi:membrane protein required for colicin V production